MRSDKWSPAVVIVMMRHHFIRYNPRLKDLVRQLRRKSTLGEVLLWKELKGKQMMGYDFHRQKPIDEDIVDFYCPALSLVIEIDGVSHFLNEKHDTERQQQLEQLGVRFLRFDDLVVKFQMGKVLETIQEWIRENGPKTELKIRIRRLCINRGDTPLSLQSRDFPSGRGESLSNEIGE